MAEIKIEKKRPIWPWIIALLIIAALVYFMFLRNDETGSDSGVEIENTISTDTVH